MRKYQGPNITIKEKESLWKFLSLPANFEKLMPESNQSFTADESHFAFQLKGMPTIRLTKVEGPSELHYQNNGGTVSFSLYPCFESNQFHFEVRGDINPMMHMMLQRPLNQLLEDFTRKIQDCSF